MTKPKGTPIGRKRRAPWETIKEEFLAGRSAASIGRRHRLHHTSILYILRTQGVDTSLNARKVIRVTLWEKRQEALRRTLSPHPFAAARDKYLAAAKLQPSPRIEHMMACAFHVKSKRLA